MVAITDFFGESPFHALKEHAVKVYQSVSLLRELFGALASGQQDEVRALAERISTLETEADKVRNQLHERLTSKVMMSLRRRISSISSNSRTQSPIARKPSQPP